MTADRNAGLALRRRIRAKAFRGPTTGHAPHLLQANLVILPQRYAESFHGYCMKNPKPCPLIGMSEAGDHGLPSLAQDLDIRSDLPRYRIYVDGTLGEEVDDIHAHWRDDFVTFALGCSFTFEQALISSGYPVRHIEQGRNVPMFKTSIETVPAAEFAGPLVVSMRPYQEKDVADIYKLCARYPHAHGTPIHWGDPSSLGIADLGRPDFGDAVEIEANEVPVFWACGVTSQTAIGFARPAISITHAPGHMLVTDIDPASLPEHLAHPHHPA